MRVLDDLAVNVEDEALDACVHRVRLEVQAQCGHSAGTLEEGFADSRGALERDDRMR